MQRHTNSELLKSWLEENGYDLGLATIVLKTNLSVSLIEKLARGSYQSSAPKERTMRLICEATNISIDKLFPLICTGEKAS